MLTSLTALAGNTDTPRVDRREAHQEKRIDAGVESGALTNRETKTLDAREDKLAADEAAAKADGHVTAGERGKLRTEARRDSHAVYRKKHNARTAG
jgi:hypothetical protein